jgi:hypothetical protein
MEKETFDIYIREFPKESPSFAEWEINLCEIPDKTRIILILNNVKAEACRKLKEIETCGGYGTLLPVYYREPRIDITKGWEIALRYMDKINLQRSSSSRLTDIFEIQMFWWRFEIEGSGEGSPSIEVDFVNGKILTSEKWGEILRKGICD